MKNLIFTLVLFCALTASAAQRITLTITVTNAAVTGNALVVNSASRYFTNANSAGTILTNLVGKNETTTNLYNQIAGFPYAGPLTLQYAGTNSIKLIGTIGGALAASSAGNWAVLTLNTQAAGNLYDQQWPIENIPESSNRIGQASAEVSGASDYSTNSFATNSTAMSNFITKGASPVQTISSQLRVSGGINNGASSLTISNGVNYGASFSSVSAGGGEAFGADSFAGGAGVALGRFATAFTLYSAAIGYGAIASNVQDVAIGYNTVAEGQFSTSVGTGARSTNGATALGQGSSAMSSKSVALGSGANVGGDAQYGIAIGSGLISGASVTNGNGIALGASSVAGATNTAAIGRSAKAIHSNSMVFATFTDSTSPDQVTIGSSGQIVRVPGRVQVEGSFTNSINTGTNVNRGDLSFISYGFSTLANGNNPGVVFGTNHNIRLSGTLTGTATITGIAGGRDGLEYDVFNDTGYGVVFTQNTSDPVPANRIENWDGNDVTLQNQGTLTIFYDASDSRWKVRTQFPTVASATSLAAASGSLATNTARYASITNPISSGLFYTNTTGQRVVLKVAWTLSGSAVSGFPSLCMTNVSTGEFYNPTNSFILAAVSSGRSDFHLSPGDYFIATNKSSGSASATVDSSFGVKE